MYFLTIIFLIIFNFSIFQCQIQAQEFVFSIPNNNLSFTKNNSLITNTNSEVESVSTSKLNNQLESNWYLLTQEKRFLLREIFDKQSVFKIVNFERMTLPKEPLLALTFDYLVETNEDLIAFDEPVIYVALENKDEKQVIFAKTLKQSQNVWQKVVLDLRNFDSSGKELVFYAGNFGDTEKNSLIYLKNLSSQIIVWRANDQVFLNNQEITNFQPYLAQGFIELEKQPWPIYSFTNKTIEKLNAILEADASLTLTFLPLEENILRNYQWSIKCKGKNQQLLSQSNYFLFPQFIIQDFWPNLDDKVILNIQNYSCDDLHNLSLEAV